ncbi:MAG: hypothetical protein WCK00_03755 [Deltaproteobacteria bacterium]
MIEPAQHQPGAIAYSAHSTPARSTSGHGQTCAVQQKTGMQIL